MVTEGEVIADEIVTLATSDGTMPTVTFSDDPDASDWLGLPENQLPGRVTFTFNTNLAVGNYTTTIFALSEGYTSAGLPISLVVEAANPDGKLIATPDEIITDEVFAGNPDQGLSITLTNTGSVTVTGITARVNGNDDGVYAFDPNDVPDSLAAGASFVVAVDFDPAAEGAFLSSFRVSSTNAPPLEVPLSGLGKDGEGGPSEPSLQFILDAHRIPINVGDPDPATNLIELPAGASYNDQFGDEVHAPLFEKVGLEDVTLEVLAVYGPTADNPIVGFGYYTAGNASDTTEIFSVGNDVARNGQTLTPTVTGTLSFDPGGEAFGFYNRWPFFNDRQLASEDELNTFGDAIPHHVRIYELPGEDNAYVIATEEHVTGFDYQDVVVIARNLKPATINPVSNTIQINFSNENTPAIAGLSKDFGQPYGSRGPLEYGWVMPGTSTPVSLVRNGRNRDPSPDVNTRNETLIHMQYDDLGGTSGPNVEGAWEILLANGTYDVTVAAGDFDDEGFGSTRHVINAEGVNVIDEPATRNTSNFFRGTAAVTVSDGRLTLDAIGGVNTKIIYATIRPSSDEPFAFFSNPSIQDGAMGINPDNLQITVAVNTADGYELDLSTLAGHVKLFERTDDGPVEVPSNSNDTGGGDAVTLTPTGQLKPLTTYVYQLDSLEANVIGDRTDRILFDRFTSTFTTSAKRDDNAPSDLAGVSFTQIKGADLGAGVDDQFTSLVVGPDGKLYGTTIGEVIKRWDINPDGSLANLEELTIDLKGSSDPVTGTPLSDTRLVIGLTFAPEATAQNLIAYVTHNALTLSDGPAWDGKVTRLSGPNLENTQDILEHLPRSKKDHLTNSLRFGEDGHLYIMQSSNSAGGERDKTWGLRSERLLTAALLRLDLAKLPNALPLSVFTTDDIGVINSAPATSMTMSDGTYNPYGSLSPVTLYATGVRNAYDFVFHSNGWTYMPTNGTGSNGNSPNTPASADYVEPGIGVRRPNGTYFTDATIPGIEAGATQKDWLFKSKGGSYHGHPVPYRGEFVLNHGGIPYQGLPGQSNGFHVDAPKYPSMLGPDANYLEVAFDFGLNKSPNGAFEYRSNAFGGKLQGMVMVTRFSGQDDVIALQPGNNSGDIVASFENIPGLQNFDDPLDVIEDVNTGNIYVSVYDRSGNGSAAELVLLRADDPASAAAVLVVAPEELIFEVTQNDEGPQTESKTVTVTNDGTADLVISDVSLTGPFSSEFTFTGPVTATVPAGGTQDYVVTFDPDGSALGYQEAALTFTSNATAKSVFDYGLHGLHKAGREGGQEPPLQAIVNTLGIGIDVGWATLSSKMNATPVGEEVIAPLFEAAGPGNVTMTPVARYSPAEELPYGWYTNTGDAITLNEVGVLATGLGEAQTLFPGRRSGSTGFDPGSAFFGIYVTSKAFGRNNYTEDELNNGLHRVRTYPVKDRQGNVVPNSYLINFEDASNGDYQDYCYVISNVRPFEPRATVLKFTPARLETSVAPGEVSAPVSTTIAANGSLDDGQVTLTASEPWVVLPTDATVGTPLDYAVDASDLAEGSYEATITASAPGFAPATARITAYIVGDDSYFARVNFQDAKFSPPTNYIADTGAGYGDRGNDFTFGWIDAATGVATDHFDAARGAARGVTDASTDNDKKLRSYNMLDRINRGTPRDWEIAVPNGTYRIEVAAGDPTSFDSKHVIRAEGVTLIDGFVGNAQNFSEVGSGIVEVLDGKLTIDDVGAAANGNTKIAYVDITLVERDDVGLTVSINATDTTLTCATTQVTLEADVPPGESVTYEWTDKDETVISSAAALVVSTAGTYTVTATTAGARSGTATLTVTESFELPYAGADASTSACTSDDVVDLFPLLTGGADEGGSWVFDGRPAPGVFDPMTDAAGIYSYIISEQGNCPADTAEVTVTVTTATVYYRDLDNDTYGDPNDSIVSCDPVIGYVTNAGDCDDQNAAVNPDAEEVCDNADNNCNEEIDEGLICSPSSVAIRINAGGDEVEYRGETFAQDVNFVGGEEYENASAQVDVLFRTERNGQSSNQFSYGIPVPAGDYEVRLHFAEILFGATGGEAGGTGKRVFDVTLEGNLVLDNYDINADVGPQTETVKTFYVSVTDGQVDLFFDASSDVGGVDRPKLSALEIISVGDVTAPVITLLGDNPLALTVGDSYVEAGATAVDETDGDLTSVIVIDDAEVDTSTAGTYMVTYDVSDSSGNAAVTAVRTVEVSAPAANVAPTAVALATPSRGTAPLAVTLDATGSSDPDGMIISYAWDYGLGSATGSTVSITLTEPGTYPIQLVVTDDDGAQSTDEILVTVLNQAGAVTEFILEAECGVVGSNWTIATDAAASNGEYAHAPGAKFIAEPPTDDPNNQIRFTLSSADPGEYYFYGRILAPNGQSDSFWYRVNGGEWVRWWRGLGTSTFRWREVVDSPITLPAGTSTIDFTFREGDTRLDKIYLSKAVGAPSDMGKPGTNCNDTPPNSPPVAIASATPESGVAPLTVTLDGSASSDSDGTIVSYDWTWSSGSATGASASGIFPEGTTVVTLTVTDDGGAVASDEVTITATGQPVDTDNDGIPDASDNCINTPNADQLDVDNDGVGDACDNCVNTANADQADADNDGAGDACDTGGILTTYWLEAECAAVGSDWDVVNDDEASNGGFVVRTGSPNFTEPSADHPAEQYVRFTVNNAAGGTYYLYGRVDAPNGQSNSYWVRINDGAWALWAKGVTTNDNGFQWREVVGNPTVLPTGSSTIDIAYREPNAKVDKLYLSTTSGFPTSIGPVGTNCDVAPANQAPLASATATPATGEAPLAVTLDGTASTDSDGNVVAYAWTWDGGSASGATTSATFPAGTTVVTLTVTDDDGATGADRVTINATAPPVDTDGDGIADDDDNCPTAFNPDQGDSDNDGTGDACDTNTGRTTYWLEAECASVGSDWETVNDGAASNGSFVWRNGSRNNDQPPVNHPAEKFVRFAVDDALGGVYNLYARVNAPTTNTDSYWVRVNGGVWTRWARGVRTNNAGFKWREVVLSPLQLPAGSSTIDFAYREANVQLDKIYLSTSAGAPTTLGPIGDDCAPVSSLTSSDGRDEMPAKAQTADERTDSANGTEEQITVGNKLPSAAKFTGSRPTIGGPDVDHFKLFPNPFVDRLSVIIEGEFLGDVIVQVLDMTGREITRQTFTKVSRQLQRELDLGSVAPGTYSVRIIQADRQSVRQVIKMH